jgi:hypothetical protein
MTGFQARIRPEPCLLFGVTISIGGRILDETIILEGNVKSPRFSIAEEERRGGFSCPSREKTEKNS